jgi:hypothetical protein
MNLTNKKLLPDVYVRAVNNTMFEKGARNSFGVTTLLRPPQAVEIGRQHWDDISEDVTDRLFQLQGTMRHLLLEKAGQESDLVERFFKYSTKPFEIFEGRSASVDVKCVIDVISAAGALSDFKNTSVYKVKKQLNAPVDPEWLWQLNFNKWIYDKWRADNEYEGFPEIKELQIIAESRDWRRGEYRNAPEGEYPQQVEVINVPILPANEVYEKLIERLRIHFAQRFNLFDTDCTDEDRWMRPQVFAVMKQGGKRAIKLHNNMDEAQGHATNATENAGVFVKGDKAGEPKEVYSVIERPKEYPRCQDYCSAAPWCKQWEQDKVIK